MSSTRARTGSISTILREGISGYISRSRLQTRLYEIFGREIEVVYYGGRISFQAPREVEEDEVRDLCEDERVNWA